MITLQFTRFDHRRHLDILFSLMMTPSEQMMFLTYSISNSLKDFDGWLQDQLKYFYHEFFIVESDDGEFIGYVCSYDHHPTDGHCKMTTYIAPVWRGCGVGALVGLRFLDHLFSFYSYRRVNCDVYQYNQASLQSLKQCGFEMTGYIKEYRYYDGDYHDLVLMSITKEGFMIRGKLLLAQGQMMHQANHSDF